MRTLNELNQDLRPATMKRIEQLILNTLLDGGWHCRYDTKDEALANYAFSELKLAGYNARLFPDMNGYFIEINF